MTVRSRRSGWVLTVVGVLLVGAAAVGVGYPLWWQHRSAAGGQHLLHETLSSQPPATGVPHSKTCRPTLPSASSASDHLAGILEVPKLQLRAPVLQGLGDPVLNVAVGHDPASPWPGEAGESVVEAHDVSYFSGISSLKPGSQVLWRDACAETVFEVTATEVVTPGTVLHPPPNDRGLALVTCYPTDALFWTPTRYVVLTALVSTRTTTSEANAPQTVTHLIVPAPAALVAEGLTLQDNPILLGTMSITGTPSPRWRQGPAALDVDADALESFFGAEKAIAQGNVGWWRDLAVPGLAMPAAWSDASRLFVAIGVEGTTVNSVDLHSADVTMKLTVRDGTLLIESVAGA
ncbi:MAG: class D sortase [Acidimicrobiales bacterium]